LIAKRLEHFGTSIFSEMTRLAEEYGAINLAQGFPDFDPPASVLEEAAKALHGKKNQYARSMGHPPLVEALAEQLLHPSSRGWWKTGTIRVLQEDGNPERGRQAA
jgi:aspartate/methionine/tyrosine aminotransferase